MAEQHNLSNDSTLAYLLNKSKPESIVDLIYPVGSIYMSMNSANPEKLFGGKWEQLPSGYFLESATSGAGDTVAAGLPNIKGSFKHNNTYSGSNVNSDGFSGALRSKAVSGTQYYLSGRSSGSGWYDWEFDASYSNSIYGRSTTVQPPAIKCYMWKRTA